MRVARLIYPTLSYHFIWRFVDRSWFFHGDEERAMYLHYLGRGLSTSDWRCFGFALMSNHIHLACLAGIEPYECWGKRVNSPFARWMNERNGRLGPVMADRPTSRTIAPGREAYALAYIHNNPVRAGVVEHARESSWTSHRFYMDVAPPAWLSVENTYARMGFDSALDFDAWVSGSPPAPVEFELAAVRKAARRRGSVEVGTPLPGGVVPIVGRPFAHVRCDPGDVVAAAAEAAGIAVAHLCSRNRAAQILAGRYAAVQCALRVGVSGADIAAALGVSPGTATNMKQRVPDELDRQVFRVAWARLEARLAATAQLNTVPPGRTNTNG